MRLAAEYPVSLVCRILEYPRSSYYYQAREPDDRALQEALTQVAATWPTYGYRRITIQLRRAGWWVNSKRVIGKSIGRKGAPPTVTTLSPDIPI